MPDQVRVFVSHHHSPDEDAFTAQLVERLQAAGADVWVDTERIPSGDFVRKINEGMAGRQWLVLVMTPDALRSRWVQSEVDAAYRQVNAGRMLGIIPIVAAPCDEADIPLLWANLLRYDATHDVERAFTALVRAIGLGEQGVAAPPTPVSVSPAEGLPPLGPAPVPPGAAPALHLTPLSLYTLGFRGYLVRGVECVLPPICPVPGGVFTMGSDKAHDTAADDSETPQYLVPVGDFAIGQHPVTVAEYACAVRAQAVREPPPEKSWFSGTTDWKAQLTALDHPVECISWYDAVAYTRWLADATQQPWRLPTEAEWEKMARWDVRTGQARIYPWGDAFDAARCNTHPDTHETLLRRLEGSTTPVGRYPTGASPYGAQDVAGNVWEWTSSLDMPYPYNHRDGREDQNARGRRVLRGGCSVSDAADARAACRGSRAPDDFSSVYGFRLALAPLQTGST
jgi:formylglycine-generating enzyme required for sulfatase activity